MARDRTLAGDSRVLWPQGKVKYTVQKTHEYDSQSVRNKEAVHGW